MDFAPSVYEHCALLIGRTPWEVSRDPDLLFEAQAEGFRRYRHGPVVVGVDIYNLEAEAYGAEVVEPAGCGIPAVTRPICRGPADVSALTPLDPAAAGRVPMVIEVAARLRAALPAADVRVPVSGPFSIAAGLMGFEALLCLVCLRPAEARDALTHLVEGQVRFCRAVRDAGLDVAFFESAAAPPLLSPAQFRSVELPALKAAITGAAEVVGHPVPCVIGGDTTPILPDILATGTRYVICPAETDQAAFLAALADRPDVMVRVNMSPAVTAGGTWDDIRAEVDRVLDLVDGRDRACLGTGALPYETPPRNVEMIRDYVQQVTAP